MSEKVLVVGATGMLGKPVAERLKEDGFDVTIMTSNMQKAESMFAGRFEIFEGDVTRPDSLKRAINGRDYLYINLSSHLDPVKYQKIEIEGTANLAKTANEAGLKRIMNISTAASHGKEIGIIFMDAKVKAERALIECGVRYTVMRPSWFFETLQQFISNDRAAILGKQPAQFHWLAARDYAAQVSQAFRTEAAANKIFYNFGPESMTMKEALQKYCDKFQPHLKAREIPFWMGKLIAMMTGNKQLKLALPFFKYFAGNNEDFDSAEADAILGKNITTLEKWMSNRPSSN